MPHHYHLEDPIGHPLDHVLGGRSWPNSRPPRSDCGALLRHFGVRLSSAGLVAKDTTLRSAGERTGFDSLLKRSLTMRILICLLLAFMTFGEAWAQDPVKADSDKYKIVFENERVRVLEYRDKPEDKTTTYLPGLYACVSRSAFKRRLTLPGRKSAVRKFKAGEDHTGDGRYRELKKEKTSDQMTHRRIYYCKLEELRQPQTAGDASGAAAANRLNVKNEWVAIFTAVLTSFRGHGGLTTSQCPTKQWHHIIG